MFTVCPKCALTLVVTAADLRVAQGYVRCGRCSSVFNALARLSDERQSAAAGSEAPAPSPEPGPEPQPDTPAEEPRSDLSPLEEALAHPEGAVPAAPGGAAEEIPEQALEFDPDTTDVRAVFIEPPPNPQWTAEAGSFKAKMASQPPPAAEEPKPEDLQVDVEIDAAFLGSMLREPATSPAEPQRTEPQHAEAQPPEPQRTEPERAAPPPQPAPRRRAMTPPVGPPAQVSRSTPTAPAAAATSGAASRTSAPIGDARQAARHAAPHVRPPAQDLEGDECELATEQAADRTLLDRLRPHTWAAGAAVALLVLTAQIVNHNRDELATTAPFKRPLTALYASLGVQLAPQWDLRAYDVRQLGASADPAGTGLITLRASIKNGAHQPQPLPLLRVMLQDRFGNRIAARDVAPRFYLPRTMPETSYLASGQRIDAEMDFVDPGANAVGFEIDACLPASGGGVTCANDLATR